MKDCVISQSTNKEATPPEGHVTSEEDSSDSSSDSDDDSLTGLYSDDSDSDGEESLASSIAELSSEINLKQQLVDQLERSQKSFQTMRTQYEDKMSLLQQQIRSVEAERDKVLKEISEWTIGWFKLLCRG